MTATIEFKMGMNGFSGLYRINNQGPWRNEYKTDSQIGNVLGNGEYPVICDGKQVGVWVQQTLGHQLKVV